MPLAAMICEKDDPLREICQLMTYFTDGPDHKYHNKVSFEACRFSSRKRKYDNNSHVISLCYLMVGVILYECNYKATFLLPLCALFLSSLYFCRLGCRFTLTTLTPVLRCRMSYTLLRCTTVKSALDLITILHRLTTIIITSLHHQPTTSNFLHPHLCHCSGEEMTS